MKIGAAVLLTAGCVASPESYLAAHPEMPARIAASIRQRNVVEGMTREQVRLVWGMPDSKPGWSEGDSWAYQRSGNGGGQASSSSWGMPFNNSNNTDSSQQSQSSLYAPRSPSSPVRRMVYFRGDQVVLVEKAAGEL